MRVLELGTDEMVMTAAIYECDHQKQCKTSWFAQHILLKAATARDHACTCQGDEGAYLTQGKANGLENHRADDERHRQASHCLASGLVPYLQPPIILPL